MPRDEHGPTIYQHRRNPSNLRVGGARFAPYRPEVTALKPHATCPEFYNPQYSQTLNVPEAPSDQSSDVSSAATLVSSSFDQDKVDSPSENFIDKPSKPWDKKSKSTSKKGSISKGLDHLLLLIDTSCEIMNNLWPQEAIPAIYRYQCGATYGYAPATRGKSIEDFPLSQPGSDLLNLKKFVTELLKRSRSTAATFSTALCYLEAVRPKICELRQEESEGRGTRGEPIKGIQHRITVDPQYIGVAEEENRRVARADGKCKLRKPLLEPSFPLPGLPSPLLCPRRTLMGALVLSAKFVQDKCYSNKAWAKLCGLPPREISRCERALGDALGWRLWVGREMLTSFGSLGTKLERTPTAILTTQFDNEFNLPINDDEVQIHRELVLAPEPLRSADTEILISPVPSLASSLSSGCGSSNWPSGHLSSPITPPLPMFVSNDPPSDSSNKLRISNLIHTDTFICETVGYEASVEAAFGIRIGSGQEVY